MTYNINGLQFNIVECDVVTLKSVTKDRDAVGAMVPNNCTIYVSKELCAVQFKRTLIHELTHATIEAIGLGHVEEFGNETLCELVAAHSEIITTFANSYLREKYNDYK